MSRQHDRIPILVRLSLVGSLVLDVVNVVTNVRSAAEQGSALFVLLAVYYLVLAAMTFATARIVPHATTDKDLPLEFRRYRLCGAVLLPLNVLVTAIVANLVSGGASYTGGDLWLVAMMVWSLVTSVLSLGNIVAFRRYGSPLLSAFNVIGLTTSLVSVLLNETAVLDRYGSGFGLDELTRTRVIAVTGVVAFGVVLVMALVMVVRGTVRLRRLEG